MPPRVAVAATALPCAGNILRSSTVAPALAEARSALGNLTASLNGTMTNMTGSMDDIYGNMTDTASTTGAANMTMRLANMTLPALAGANNNNNNSAAGASLRAFGGLAGRAGARQGQGSFGSRLQSGAGAARPG
jgi:hypothetical protein